jgi:hypothetical protein
LSEKDLVGIWQAGGGGFASDWANNYQFFANGKFIFNYNRMIFNGKRIVSVTGTYSISGDSIKFQVHETEELVGGKMIRGASGSEEEWILEGAKQVTAKQAGSAAEIAIVRQCEKDVSSLPCIFIDGRKYAKVRNNPNDYP